MMQIFRTIEPVKGKTSRWLVMMSFASNEFLPAEEVPSYTSLGEIQSLLLSYLMQSSQSREAHVQFC